MTDAIELMLEEIASVAALGLEAIAVVLVIWGALLALIEALRHAARPDVAGWRRRVWVDLGAWLLLALQFALGADIVRSAIAPTWNDIGQLAAIALIRTFLSHFLEKDIVEVRRETKSDGLS